MHMHDHPRRALQHNIMYNQTLGGVDFAEQQI